MTVCIANVAAKSKAIVMVSDKAVAYSGNMLVPLVSDTDARKFLRIGNTFWYALLGGDPSFAFNVVKAAERSLEKKSDKKLSDSVGGMMYCMKSAYQKCRESAVVDQVLKPRLLSKNLLVARPITMQPLGEEISLAVLTLAKEFKTNSNLLICGFDSKREPHIFSVTNPGKCDLHDTTGFFAVGVGATTAIARLLILEARKEDQLGLALYQAFDAKVNAEVVEDVGFNWDAEILVPGRPAIRVPDRVVRLIERAYENLPLTPFASGSRKAAQTMASLKMSAKLAKRLTSFVDSVLSKGDPIRARRRRQTVAR